MEARVLSPDETAGAAPAVRSPREERLKYMFLSSGEIISALRRAPEAYDPRSTSLLSIRRGGRDADGDPFRPGFLDGFEERAELRRLLGLLDWRSRMLLVLWFVEGLPVVAISRRLHVSRVHCYRLRDQALNKMLEIEESNG